MDIIVLCWCLIRLLHRHYLHILLIEHNICNALSKLIIIIIIIYLFIFILIIIICLHSFHFGIVLTPCILLLCIYISTKRTSWHFLEVLFNPHKIYDSINFMLFVWANHATITNSFVIFYSYLLIFSCWITYCTKCQEDVGGK